MSEQEEKQKLLVRVKIDAEIICTHEWIYRYSKEKYPKIMMPRSEIKVNAEVDFFDRDLLEYLVGMEDES